MAPPAGTQCRGWHQTQPADQQIEQPKILSILTILYDPFSTKYYTLIFPYLLLTNFVLFMVATGKATLLTTSYSL